jgi:hypothetical protein
MNKYFFVEPLSCSHHISSTQLNYCTTSIRDTINMPRNIGQVDCHFKNAIEFLMKYRNMALLDNSNSNGNATATAQCDNQPACKGPEVPANGRRLTRGGGNKRAV